MQQPQQYRRAPASNPPPPTPTLLSNTASSARKRRSWTPTAGTTPAKSAVHQQQSQQHLPPSPPQTPAILLSLCSPKRPSLDDAALPISGISHGAAALTGSPMALTCLLLLVLLAAPFLPLHSISSSGSAAAASAALAEHSLHASAPLASLVLTLPASAPQQQQQQQQQREEKALQPSANATHTTWQPVVLASVEALLLAPPQRASTPAMAKNASLDSSRSAWRLPSTGSSPTQSIAPSPSPTAAAATAAAAAAAAAAALSAVEDATLLAARGFHASAAAAPGGAYLLTIHLGPASAPHPQHGRLCVSVRPPSADPLMAVSRCLSPAHTQQLAAAAAGAAALVHSHSSSGMAQFLLTDSTPGSSVHTSLLMASGALTTSSLVLPQVGEGAVALLGGQPALAQQQQQQPRLMLVQAS